MLQRRRRGFTTRWTVAGDATARTITLPLNNGNGAAFNCTVNWGDGTSSVITAYDDADRAHTYAADGTYDVEIRGTCEGWSFNNGGDKLKIVKILFWGDRPVFSGFKYFAGGMRGCTNLTKIGYNQIMPSGSGPTSLVNGFSTCALAGSIPPCLIRYLTGVTTVTSLLANNQLTGSIPAGFLSGLTSLTNISGMLNNNQLTGAIPSGFLSGLVNITEAIQAFRANQFSGEVPADLFRDQALLTSVNSCFALNDQLRLSAYCFYREGEQATRFLGKTMDFTSCFARSAAAYTGAQGTAPDLWNCDFGETITLDVSPAVDWEGGDTITGQTSGATAEIVAKVSALVYKIKKHFGTFTLGEVVGVTGVADKLADQGAANPTFAGTPTSTGCFANHSIATVSNYNDIPASWR